MRLRPRFSVQFLLLGVTFVGLCLAGWNAYHAWYRHNHGREFINTQLHSSLRNGDSVEHVSARLGVEGVDVDTDRTLGSKVPGLVRLMYAERESGLLSSDQLLSFSVGRSGVTLQFRDGKLVNHDPTEFINVGLPISFRKLRDTPVGNQVSQLFWQMGVPQVVAGFVAIPALFYAVVLARRRRYSARFIKSMIALPIALCTAIVCTAAKLEPALLGCVIAGFTGTVAWNLAGYVTGAQKHPLSGDSI